MKYAVFLLVLFMISNSMNSQQVPDLTYNPEITNSAYKQEEGPLILIDEAHHNFHTIDGRYKPFAQLLTRDGYIVKSNTEIFNMKSLNSCKILVIANALNEINVDNWELPNPSAFTKEEIKVIKVWVKKGGRLFLIADHMPFPGAAQDLANVFGFNFLNGFNINVVNPAFFHRNNGTITKNIITSGRDSTEIINRIPNAEGQAISFPDDSNPILLFDSRSMILIPKIAWKFHSKTPIKNIEGLAQGAYKAFGKGKVVVFGEASMFSAQIGNPGKRKMGMNNSQAKDNHKLLLNIIHWLDDILE